MTECYIDPVTGGAVLQDDSKELKAYLAKKAELSHKHEMTEIIGLFKELAKKQDLPKSVFNPMFSLYRTEVKT